MGSKFSSDGDRITKAIRPGKAIRPNKKWLAVDEWQQAVTQAVPQITGKSGRGPCEIVMAGQPVTKRPDTWLDVLQSAGIEPSLPAELRPVPPPFAPYDVGAVPCVELLPGGKIELFRLSDAPGFRTGEPAYTALITLSEMHWPNSDDLGEAALAACSQPDAIERVQKRVQLTLENIGLLTFGDEHDCYAEQNNTEKLRADESATGEYKSRYAIIHHRLYDHDLPRLLNAIPWVLQEALVLRRADVLARALTTLKVRGDRRALDRLWKINPDGGDLVLFDTYRCPPPPRWEAVAAVSVHVLRAMINAHINAAFMTTGPVDEAFNRVGPRSGRTSRVMGPWLRLETGFNMPLAAFWLQFVDAVLRGTGARLCKECRNTFEPKRIDQEFCTPRCGGRYQQRQFRQRRKEAR